MRCQCHTRLFFSDAHERALTVLVEWVKKNGVVNLSHRLTHSGPEEAHIYNQCSWYFGKNKPLDLRHLSALAIACHYACIDYQPGMLRSTSADDDIVELLKLYDAGEMLTESAMTKHSRLRHRLKRRFNDTWFSVFEKARMTRPDVEFRRFFGNAPDGVFVDLMGKVALCKTKEEIEAFAVRVFGDYVKTQDVVRSIAQLIGEGPHELCVLYKRLLDQEMDARGIVERATGRTFPVYSMSRQSLTPLHLLNGGEHPTVASFSELVVDTALATVVLDYEKRHRHQVPFREFVPVADWKASPYTGNRGPVVDIVIDDKMIVEVSFATERRNPKYIDKMRWKVERLRENGFVVVNARIEDGAQVVAQGLAGALSQIGVAVNTAPMVEVLWAAAFQYGTKDIQQSLRDVQ